jgi:hypothetical protein
LGNPGKLSSCFTFSGANDSKVVLPDVSTFQFGTGNFSMEFYVKASQFNLQSKNGIIGGEDGSATLYVTSAGYLGFGKVNFGDASSSYLVVPIDGLYHCIQASYNHTSHNLILGVDGQYVTISYTVDFTAGASSNGIGYVTPNFYKWIGAIDEPTFWNVSLTQTQLQDSYSGASEPVVSGTEVITYDKKYGAGQRVYFYDKHYQGGAKIKTFKTATDGMIPQDAFTGDVLYVDPKTAEEGGAGSDANDGLTPETPILTLSHAATLLDNSFEYLALANATHSGYLPISTLVRTVGNPLVITTWHKYGSGNAKIDGRKILGTFNGSSPYWKIVDAQLPTGSPDPNTNYIDIESGTYSYYVNFMNGIYIDDVFYKISKYPREKRYLKMEAKASDNTYLDDTDSTKAAGYWTGATLVTQAPTWVPVKVNVTNYNGSRFSISGVNDEEFSGITTNGLDGLKYFIVNHRNAARVNGQWYSKPVYDSLVVFYNGNLNSHIVKAPIQDILIDIDASQYITIKNLDLIGSNKEHIRLHGCTGIIIDSCNFNDSPYAGIYSKTTSSLTVTHSNFNHSGDLGIGLNNNTTVRINNNTFRDIGTDETFGGDKNGVHFCGIQSSLGHGILEIKDNLFDSIAYCATAIGNHASTAHNQVIFYRNYIRNAMMMMSDGGAVYTFGTDEAYRKYIRRNLIVNTYNNQAFHRDNLTETRGIYLDEGGGVNINRYWIVDSNYVYKAPQLVFINSGAQYNTMRNNLLVDATYRTSSQSFGLRARQIGNQIDNSTLTRNSVVLSDSNSYGMYWSWATPFDARGCVIDSNYYFNPFRETTSEVWLEYITGLTARTLTYVRANTTYEDNGTFNSTGWTFKDVSCITSSQFIWFFSNWSNSSHSFSLGSATFKDLQGNNFFGSVTVPAYGAKCLMYVSGSLAGINSTWPVQP